MTRQAPEKFEIILSTETQLVVCLIYLIEDVSQSVVIIVLLWNKNSKHENFLSFLVNTFKHKNCLFSGSYMQQLAIREKEK